MQRRIYLNGFICTRARKTAEPLEDSRATAGKRRANHLSVARNHAATSARARARARMCTCMGIHMGEGMHVVCVRSAARTHAKSGKTAAKTRHGTERDREGGG